ncbi:MAG: ABC transporter ATP-binding protein [Anaerolineae bacterium]|nr:ABC transporter ATP-binding protein [Anaerolineae bacterium]
MPQLALRLRNVTYTYSPGERPLEALIGVDLDVASGEFVTLVGPSGCGKTTLLRLVAGLARPTGGIIEIPADGHAGIGFVFQSGALMPWRTVRGNIRLPLELAGLGSEESHRQVDRMIELVGLGGFESAYPRELSGGMQQRVALARALVSQPALLLLDEPFVALDAFSRERMNDELQRIWLASATTVIMVTHSIEEAVFLSDRVVVLSHRPGRVKGVFPVPFERPRLSQARYSPEFTALAARIRRAVDAGAYGEEAGLQAKVQVGRS